MKEIVDRCLEIIDNDEIIDIDIKSLVRSKIIFNFRICINIISI